ncbi:MAG TPA: GNAT family N-acetyltransferase, partial [Methanocella sp.]|nr:GNAT family N-acetyltransferase [Methanocella sp.]
MDGQTISAAGITQVTVEIKRVWPESPDAVTLIGELSDHLAPLYPKWNQFGLSPSQLVSERVAFFVAYVDGAPAGCGGVKPCGGWGEVKRLYVRPEFRGRGLGRLMLQRLEEHASSHGCTRLRLETGVYQPEAMGLYERVG